MALYQQFVRHLDTVGDGSGDTEMTGDYSGAGDEEFLLTCQPGELLVCTRMLVYVEDAGAPDAAAWGNGITLTEGQLLRHVDAAGNVIQDLFDGQPLRTSGGLSKFCYDVQEIAFGSGNNIVAARWTFQRSGSALVLKPGESLAWTCRDNHSGLVSQQVVIQGNDRKVIRLHDTE